MKSERSRRRSPKHTEDPVSPTGHQWEARANLNTPVKPDTIAYRDPERVGVVPEYRPPTPPARRGEHLRQALMEILLGRHRHILRLTMMIIPLFCAGLHMLEPYLGHQFETLSYVIAAGALAVLACWLARSWRNIASGLWWFPILAAPALTALLLHAFWSTAAVMILVGLGLRTGRERVLSAEGIMRAFLHLLVMALAAWFFLATAGFASCEEAGSRCAESYTNVALLGIGLLLTPVIYLDLRTQALSIIQGDRELLGLLRPYHLFTVVMSLCLAGGCFMVSWFTLVRAFGDGHPELYFPTNWVAFWLYSSLMLIGVTRWLHRRVWRKWKQERGSYAN